MSPILMFGAGIAVGVIFDELITRVVKWLIAKAKDKTKDIP